VVSLAMNYFTRPPATAPAIATAPATPLPSPPPTPSGQAAPATASASATASATAPATSSPNWSNYAWGGDYHRLLKKRLKALLAVLQKAYPGINGIACVDTSPVMEKVWARQAGLGWQGKHTCLITRELGSWVFLGELLLDVALPPDEPFGDDLCGSCSACLEACPTGALTAPYELDSRRCISYLNIEHRGDFTPGTDLNGWLYGCDICQQVCPWNEKFARESMEPAFRPREFISSWSLDRWQRLSAEEWDKLFTGSPARRTKYDGLMRNIEMVGGK
ncbi:MAG: tRNA epoxyqueuosine(34) reductase QueG, partial [Candidatus Marinimicrobia bacterium]|nr:tRNA epoxyqueuosine(34) reductase QueG [Candidatus Neomarinimicrobiota bacterium]